MLFQSFVSVQYRVLFCAYLFAENDNDATERKKKKYNRDTTNVNY